MGKDLPDGTRKMVLEFSGGLVGLEELAARLGSIVPFDMQGNVFLREDFEGTLVDWTSQTAGVGSAVALTVDYYHSKSYSVNLKAATLAGAYARLKRYLPHLGSKKYGFTCAVILPSTHGCALKFMATLKKSAVLTYAGVEIENEDGYIKVRTAVDSWTNVLAIPGHDDNYTWHLLEWYCDLATGYHTLLRWDDTEIDLSAYALGTAAEAGTDTYCLLECGYYATSNLGGDYYVDDIVAVRNVP
mgnify:CR=1 FL=1